MTVGFMIGGVLVAVLAEVLKLPLATCMFAAASLWQDVAPKRTFHWHQANPLQGFYLLSRSRAVKIYAAMVLLDGFSVQIFMCTLASYSKTFLGWDKMGTTALLFEWAFVSALMMAFITPRIIAAFGETAVLKFGYAVTAIFYVLVSFVTKENSYLGYVLILLYSAGMVSPPLTKAS